MWQNHLSTPKAIVRIYFIRTMTQLDNLRRWPTTLRHIAFITCPLYGANLQHWRQRDRRDRTTASYDNSPSIFFNRQIKSEKTIQFSKWMRYTVNHSPPVPYRITISNKYVFTSGSREYHVGIHGSCSDLGHPATMASEGGPKCHLFCSHFDSAIVYWWGSKQISTPLMSNSGHRFRCREKKRLKSISGLQTQSIYPHDELANY